MPCSVASVLTVLALSPLCTPKIPTFPPCNGYMWGSDKIDDIDRLLIFGLSGVPVSSVLPLVTLIFCYLSLFTELGVFMACGPFILYHCFDGPKADPRYIFPASISHTIRRQGPARRAYGIGYFLFAVVFSFVVYKRRAMGALVCFVWILVGFGHVVIAVPEPHEQGTGAKVRTGLHYVCAAACLLGGFGYGFAQPESTSVPMKSIYLACVISLVGSLMLLNQAGGEDESDPLTYYRRFAFMLAEYGILISASAAVARPVTCPGAPV